MRRAFKYRLFTNANQERELDIALETHRRLDNTYLDYRELAYSQHGITITYVDCSRWFKRRRETNPYFARINFSSAQATMRRLDKAFAAFFRRVGAGEEPGFPASRDAIASIRSSSRPTATASNWSAASSASSTSGRSGSRCTGRSRGRSRPSP